MSIVTYLKQSDIFSDLTGTQLELIASISSEQLFKKSELIFDENSPGTELYVIASGEIEIVLTPAVIGRADTSEPKVIARLRRGQCFGEVALVDEGFRSAGARAADKETSLVIIPRNRLIRLCDMYPELGYRLMRNLAADLAMKIRSTDLKVRELLSNKHDG